MLVCRGVVYLTGRNWRKFFHDFLMDTGIVSQLVIRRFMLGLQKIKMAYATGEFTFDLRYLRAIATAHLVYARNSVIPHESQ